MDTVLLHVALTWSKIACLAYKVIDYSLSFINKHIKLPKSAILPYTIYSTVCANMYLQYTVHVCYLWHLWKSEWMYASPFTVTHPV